VLNTFISFIFSQPYLLVVWKTGRSWKKFIASFQCFHFCSFLTFFHTWDFFFLVTVRTKRKHYYYPREIHRHSYVSGWWGVKVKIKQSYYSPGHALRVPGGWDFQISRQLADEGGKVVSPTHRPPLLPPQEIFLILIFLGDCVNTRSIVRPEGLCHWKIPVTSAGIEPATFRLVVRCLNHLRYQQRASMVRGLAKSVLSV